MSGFHDVPMAAKTTTASPKKAPAKKAAAKKVTTSVTKTYESPGKKAKGYAYEEVVEEEAGDEYEVLNPKRSRTSTFPDLPKRKRVQSSPARMETKKKKAMAASPAKKAKTPPAKKAQKSKKKSIGGKKRRN